MKKKVLSLALIALSLVAFNAPARTGSSDGTAKQETVQGKKDGKKSDKKDGKKSDRKDGKKCDKAGCDKKGRDGKFDGKKDRKPRVDPFEGLTLTDTQKSQLQQLGEQRKAARQEQMQARKESKQRNDSLKLQARRADKKAYLDQVKAIVGPDQYVIFLENMYVNAPAKAHFDKGAGHHAKAGKEKGRKGQRDGKGGQRGGEARTNS